MLLGADNMRSQMQTQVLARRTEPLEAADQPLPAGIPFAAKVPEPLGGASHRADCAARAGRVLLRSLRHVHQLSVVPPHDGALARRSCKILLNRRGLDYGLTARVERQISLKESALSELLGPTVIADVAMVGGDLFFREGAAVGMLFQARNNFALSSDFTRQRAETLQARARLHAKTGRNRRPSGFVPVHARQSRAFVLRRRWRFPLRHQFAAAGGAILRSRRGQRIPGPNRRVSLRPLADAHQQRLHRVRLSLRRVFPQPCRAALPGRNGSPPAIRGRNRHGHGRAACRPRRSA